MNRPANSPLDRLAWLAATGLGVGLIPVAPGTFGSLWGVLLAWGMTRLDLLPYFALAILIVGIGIPICSRGARQFPNPDDPGSVVYDEIAAFPLVFLPVAFGSVSFDIRTAIAGFLWFRLFDIAKPWPVRRAEQFTGGLGIMADDQVAGLYAAGGLWLTAWLLGWS